MNTKPIALREFQATYTDGTTYKLLARGVREAVMSAAELNQKTLTRITPIGEW